MVANNLIAINNESGCWPTQSQELLLRAALLQGTDAIRAWEQWTSSVNVEVVDFGSHRLLPQVYANLLRHGVKHPLMAKFKGIYRYYLYQNQVLFHSISPLLGSLQDAGIESLLLKGSALIPLYYKEFGLRPMQDFDLMVHPEQLSQTIKTLGKLGWQLVHPSARAWIPFRHSTPLRNENGRFLDLHWHVFWECWHPRDDGAAWRTAIPIQIGSVTALALDPTHQLLHICAHGAKWNEVPPVRWVADAMMILNSPQSHIDWSLFVDCVRNHKLTLPILHCLRYLQEGFLAPIPISVLSELRSIPISRKERDVYEASTAPLRPHTAPQIVRLLCGDYAWLTSGIDTWQKPAIFAKYLQQKWGMKYLWHLPFFVCHRTMRRIWLSASQYLKPSRREAFLNGREWHTSEAGQFGSRNLSSDGVDQEIVN